MHYQISSVTDEECYCNKLLQSLTRMGGQVTRVDAVEKNIGVGNVHAVRPPIFPSLSLFSSSALE